MAEYAYGMGAAVGDSDPPARPLYVANVNGNQLFQNNRDDTFTGVTAQAGFGGTRMNGRKMRSVGIRCSLAIVPTFRVLEQDVSRDFAD